MCIDEIQWDDTSVRDTLLNYGGSKSGAYFYLEANAPELHKHLPTGTAYLAPGEDPDRFVNSFDCSKPKIVRGCHVLDLVGMVDVLPTCVVHFSFNRVRENIRLAIKDILSTTQNIPVMKYVRSESGKSFDGKIGVLVQDYYEGAAGSIIEHPHERGMYRIAYRSPTIIGNPIVDEEMCDGQGHAIDPFKTCYKKQIVMKTPAEQYHTIDVESVQAVIALYRKIYESALMPSKYSFQMEYGWHDGVPLFFQARIFRPFEPAADFPVTIYDGCTTLFYDAVGITPEKGVEMPLAEMDESFVEAYKKQPKVAYAYNNYGHKQCPDISIHPQNIGAYLPYQNQVLEHGHYRWMQKSPVTLVNIRRSLTNDQQLHDYLKKCKRYSKLHDKLQNIDDGGARVRIISNGIIGAAEIID